MATNLAGIMDRPSQRDGYYVLADGNGFVAFEQERECRFHEARFASRSEAERHIVSLRSATQVK